MKMILIKVKVRKRESQKHESDADKNEGVQKWKFEKLTEIEAQTQP